MHHDLSDRHIQLLRVIAAHTRLTGWPPTVREIGAHVGVRSTGHVAYHLQQLEAKGYLQRSPRTSRGLLLTPAALMLLAENQREGIQLLGMIAAGEPLDIVEQGDLLAGVDPQQYPPHTFALVVRGDSMTEDGILSGDYILITPNPSPPERAIIVATQHTAALQGAATLKRFHRTQDAILLVPANARYTTLQIAAADWDREWLVQGVVVGLVRDYQETGDTVFAIARE